VASTVFKNVTYCVSVWSLPFPQFFFHSSSKEGCVGATEKTTHLVSGVNTFSWFFLCLSVSLSFFLFLVFVHSASYMCYVYFYFLPINFFSFFLFEWNYALLWSHLPIFITFTLSLRVSSFFLFLHFFFLSLLFLTLTHTWARAWIHARKFAHIISMEGTYFPLLNVHPRKSSSQIHWSQTQFQLKLDELIIKAYDKIDVYWKYNFNLHPFIWTLFTQLEY